MSSHEARAQQTDQTLKALSAALEGHLGADRERILREDTCVYVVGSGGRGEMSERSDVDLFVARTGRAASDVDALLLRQAIVRALFERGLPEPSRGGAFLEMHTDEGLCGLMGTPEDDAKNTFTARMLLLLESRGLLGEEAYANLLKNVVDRYWKNHDEHEADYQPFVLVNDIVRYWRVLLLNYEAKNTEKERELGQPDREAERRLRSYKLRFSRCMTCFSALAMLLAITRAGMVTKRDVLEMVRERPIERLQVIKGSVENAGAHVDALLTSYERFLQHTARADLRESFSNEAFRRERSSEGNDFGNRMFTLIQSLAEGHPRSRELFRYMVV